MTYTVLGLGPMHLGTWATWVSGLASTAAVIVALSAQFFVARNRGQRDKRLRTAVAKDLGWKILQLLNAVLVIYRHVWQMSDSSLKGPDGTTEVWRSLLPLIGVTKDESYSLNQSHSDFLLETGNANLLMQASLLDQKHRSLVGAVNDYATRYQVIQQLTPPPIRMEGSRAAYEFDEQTVNMLRPHWLQLEFLAEQIREMSAETVEIGLECVALYDEHCKSIFGKVLLKIKSDDSVDFGNLREEIPRDPKSNPRDMI